MARLNERGLTLVEVLIALALLGVAAGAMLTAFSGQLRANALSERRAWSISAAEMELEALRMQDPELMPTSGSSTPRLVPVGDLTFEVVTHYCERAELCPTTTSRYVRVEVRSQGSNSYDVEAIFTQLR